MWTKDGQIIDYMDDLDFHRIVEGKIQKTHVQIKFGWWVKFIYTSIIVFFIVLRQCCATPVNASLFYVEEIHAEAI